MTGEITAGAILAALFRRERTGEGCAIEVPMHETMAAFVLQENSGRQRSCRLAEKRAMRACWIRITNRFAPPMDG